MPATGRSTISAWGWGDTDIPDFVEVVGLARLYRQTVERIRRSGMTDAEQAAIIGMIEAQYRAARAAATESRRSV
jgi:hypothetical protein